VNLSLQLQQLPERLIDGGLESCFNHSIPITNALLAAELNECVQQGNANNCLISRCAFWACEVLWFSPDQDLNAESSSTT
jgi:hypothetical protein